MAEFKLIPLNYPSFSALKSPTNPRPSSDGTSLTLNTGHGTDYWRVPFPAPGRDDQSAGLWAMKRKVGTKGFEVRCEIEVGESEQQSILVLPTRSNIDVVSDQGALIVQLSPTEWVKTGAEFDQGEMWHGVVVCNPFSDWSIQPLSSRRRFTISFDPTTTTLRVFLGPPSSSGGSTDATSGDIMIREVKSFGLISAGLTHLVPGEVPADVDPAKKLAEMEVTIGLMACSPIGKGEGPECTFRRFEMRDGVREV